MPKKKIIEEELSDSFENSEVEDDDEVEKEKLCNQIENYYRTFPEVFKDRKKIKLRKNTPVEILKDEIKLLDQEVTKSSSVRDMGNMAVSFAYGLQKILDGTPIKLNGPKIGLADIVNNQKAAYDEVFKQLACKYNIMGLVCPEIKLAGLAVQSIFVAHGINSQEEAQKPSNGKEEMKSSSSDAKI